MELVAGIVELELRIAAEDGPCVGSAARRTQSRWGGIELSTPELTRECAHRTI